MAKYNGHKNWNHWNVSLWINNDEGLYQTAQDCIAYTDTKEAAARLLMSRLSDKTPDGAPYSKSAVRAALVGM